MAEIESLPRPTWLWLTVSFLIPIVGILLGIMHRRREEEENKKFGRKALTAGIAGLATCVVLYVVWFAVLGAADIIG